MVTTIDTTPDVEDEFCITHIKPPHPILSIGRGVSRDEYVNALSSMGGPYSPSRWNPYDYADDRSTGGA